MCICVYSITHSPVPSGSKAQGGLEHARLPWQSCRADSTQPNVPSPPPMRILRFFSFRNTYNLHIYRTCKVCITESPSHPHPHPPLNSTPLPCHPCIFPPSPFLHLTSLLHPSISHPTHSSISSPPLSSTPLPPILTQGRVLHWPGQTPGKG